MDEDRQREALIAAGYTGRRGALMFAAFLMTVGAAFGSVVFAILLLFLVPGTSETLSTIAGAVAGALAGLGLAFLKVRQGNLDALELVEDAEWKRVLRRERGKSL
jgi:outer membrane lipoprotein SlyB